MNVRQWVRGLILDTPQQTQSRLCKQLLKPEYCLSEDERRFVALMQERLSTGLALHENHAKRISDLYAVAQGELAW